MEAFIPVEAESSELLIGLGYAPANRVNAFTALDNFVEADIKLLIVIVSVTY